MTDPVARRLEIAAPVAAVWPYIDDDKLIPQWIPEVVGIRYPDGKSAVAPAGTRFVQSIKEGRRVKEYDGVVLAHDPLRLIAIRLGDRHFHVDVTYRLEATAANTTVLHYTATVYPHTWLSRLMLPLGRRLMSRMLDRQLRRLKALSEAAGR